MSGRVTRADGVRGERRGQRVRRTWWFLSSCVTGPCTDVLLTRQRSNRQRESLVLHRVGVNAFSGRGKFFVALRCRGRTYPRGGLAYTRVRVVVGRATTVQSTRFATVIRATYTNPRRVNRTPCSGSIGRDGGTYSGRLTSPPPSPPVPEFTSATDPITRTIAFGDASRSPTGAPMVRWAWDFGDPASGSANSSTLSHPSHRYVVPGTYTVTLTVIDANGLTATITHQVAI